jgi:predicted S18 family serine protease
MNLTVELREGEGRILVDTVPRIGIDLQTSARTAVLVAENVTGASFQKSDVIITITANQSTEIVDGPSAGAAITIASIAAIKGDALRKDVIITGTIDPYGRIGSVGGVLEKAVAAAEHQINLFLVPKGEGMVLITTPKVYRVGAFTVVVYEKKAVDLQGYLEEEGYPMKVMEVENIMDAYKIFTTPGE